MWNFPFFCPRFIWSVFAFPPVYTKSWHHVRSPGREVRQQTVLESITFLVCCSCSLLPPQHREMSVTEGHRESGGGRRRKRREKKNDRMINTMTVKRTSTSLKWLFQISWGVPWFLALQMNSILSSSTKPYHSNTRWSWTQESVLSQAK